MNVYICSAARTAIGTYGGTLRDVPAAQLGIAAANAAIERAGVDLSLIHIFVPASVADQYQDAASLSELNIAVESGSAGQAAAEELGLNFTAVQSQANALMEVASGASDACVIDLLMAGAMIGEGTSYPDLTYTVNLNEASGADSEYYGVGFRQGSDLTEAFNEFYAAAYADGTVEQLATTYGVQESIVAPAE